MIGSSKRSDRSERSGGRRGGRSDSRSIGRSGGRPANRRSAAPLLPEPRALLSERNSKRPSLWTLGRSQASNLSGRPIAMTRCVSFSSSRFSTGSGAAHMHIIPLSCVVHSCALQSPHNARRGSLRLTMCRRHPLCLPRRPDQEDGRLIGRNKVEVGHKLVEVDPAFGRGEVHGGPKLWQWYAMSALSSVDRSRAQPLLLALLAASCCRQRSGV